MSHRGNSMNEHCTLKPVVLEKLQAGLLAPHLESLSRELSERGYALATSNYALRLFAAIGSWLESSGHTILDLDEAVLEAFLVERYRRFKPRSEDHPMQAFLLACLRRTDVLMPRPESPDLDPTAPIREAFRAHLISQRDLVPETVSRLRQRKRQHVVQDKAFDHAHVAIPRFSNVRRSSC